MMLEKKTTRSISINWIEAVLVYNKNNKEIDVAGNKVWVSHASLVERLELIEFALQFDLYKEKDTEKYLIKTLEEAKKLVNELNKELMNDDVSKL